MSLNGVAEKVWREVVHGQLDSDSSCRKVAGDAVRLVGLIPALVVFAVAFAVTLGILAVASVAVLTGETMERS